MWIKGSLQTGIQASAKLAATHAKVAVDVVASMPQGIAMIGSELFSDGQQTSQQLKQMVYIILLIISRYIKHFDIWYWY